MAWGKAGSTTLSSAGDTITVSGMTASKFNFILGHNIQSGAVAQATRLDNDSGSNYAYRRSVNGASDVTSGSFTRMVTSPTGGTHDEFSVQYIINISSKEKLNITHSMAGNTAGAGNAPSRAESVNKWANTSTQFTRIDNVNIGAGDYAIDSNVSAIGSDLTPTAAVPAIDNVQDNSLFVEKENARRYWFDADAKSNVELTTGAPFTTHSAGWDGRVYASELEDLPNVGDVVTGGKIYVGTSAGNVRLGLYSDNGSGVPQTLLAETASTAVGSAGAWQEIDFITPYTTTSTGKLHLGLQTDTSSSGFGYAVNVINGRSSMVTSYSAFPTTFSGTSDNAPADLRAVVERDTPTWTMQPTFEDNTFSSGWTSTDPTNVNTNTTTKVIDANVPSTGAQTGVLTYPLGYTLENNFVLEFKMEITSYTDNTDNTHQEIYIGMTNNTSAYNVSQQFIGMSISNAASGGGNDRYALQEFYNEALTANNGQGDSTNRPNANDIRYHRISKSGSTLTYSIYSDSSYSTLVETISGTATDTYSLNTISVKLRALDGTQNGVLTVEIDDIKIYNGVGTVN